MFVLLAKLAKTEAELAAMGRNPECGLSNVCQEMELMLGGGPSSTSTPNVTLSSSTLPSLVSVSSIATADSGHDSGPPTSASSEGHNSPPGTHTPDRAAEPSPVFSPITPRVNKDFEMGNYVYCTSLTDYYNRRTLTENRQRRLQALAPGGMESHDHPLEKEKLIMILSTLFIHVVKLIYFRNLNHVSKFPWAIRLADRCNLLHCVWEIKNN